MTAGSGSVHYFDDDAGTSGYGRKRDNEDEGPESPRRDKKKSKTPRKSAKKEKSNEDVSQEDGATVQGAPSGMKKGKKTERGKSGKERRPATEGDANPEAPRRDAKREKKSRRTSLDKTPINEATPEGENNDMAMEDADGGEGSQGVPLSNLRKEKEEADEDQEKKDKGPKKGKKKKKKEHRGDGQADTPNDTQLKNTDKRHATVLERKVKSLKLAKEAASESRDVEPELEPQEVHDLEPLPQPKLVSEEKPVPTYETLPPWLANPIRVAQDTRTPFSELGILPKAARVLEEKGYRDAFAVQTAAIPLLLPSSKRWPGDILISAATGSGKTLAYALPIVRDISQGLVTRIRALVVLPTRELVKQAQAVFELCSKAYEGGERKRVRIGISVGSQTLESEQKMLIERLDRYEPEEYNRILEENRKGRTLAAHPWDPDPRLGRIRGDIAVYFSKVDVLICTPGRLVEHMEETPGFDLDYVRWLVIDEADKLLEQSFQRWLRMTMDRLKTRKFKARQFHDIYFEGVRKVIVSATLTRDLNLLKQLSLQRPQLIVLESDGKAQIAEHSLPALLTEHAVRVHNTNLKPLYLLDLLKNGHMEGAVEGPVTTAPDVTNGDATSDTSPDSSSDSSSSDSGPSSDSSSESEPESELPAAQTPSFPVALIFTKSNESALRLSRLLTILDGSLSQHVSTLTSTTPTHIRRKTLRAFTAPSSPVRLIIASDLVARGIDLPNLGHVINYDLPPSVAGYIHRVGRTARAGRPGRAWTLVGDDESGWFWGKIAKGTGIRRAQKVGRVRIDQMPEERIQDYEAALEKLGQEAMDTRGKQ